ncbi:MAG: hypothetical protein JOZ18_06750 [Chloroflexi bacterium]|nr:hypothetical protein [Chloroflexota bacterium]
MSQTEGGRPSQQAIARAEELLDSLGQGIGSFGARIHEKADQLDQPGQPAMPQAMEERLTGIRQGIGSFAARIRGRAGQPGQSESGGEGAGQPQTMQQAERLADEMGQRVSRGSSRVSLQMRQIAARAGERFEDMWAEVQQIRGRNSGQPR